jgi:hypothetical protein
MPRILPGLNVGEPVGNHVLPEGNSKHYPGLGTAPAIATDYGGGILRRTENIKCFNV